MEKAKVYFTDMRTGYGGLSLPQKLANPATYHICAPTMPRPWPML